MSIKKVLRTLLVNLSIWTVGDVTMTLLLHEKFEWSLLFFIAGVIVLRDLWTALRKSLPWDQPEQSAS